MAYIPIAKKLSTDDADAVSKSIRSVGYGCIVRRDGTDPRGNPTWTVIKVTGHDKKSYITGVTHGKV